MTDTTLGDFTIEAEGTVTYAPGTTVITVVVPPEVPLRSVQTIRAAVNLTRRYGALVEQNHIPVE